MHYLETYHADHIAQRVERRRLFGALWHGFKVFAGILSLCALIFLLATAPAQWERAQYWVDTLRIEVAQLLGSRPDLNTKNWISPSRFLREPMFESVDVVAAPTMDANTLSIPAIDVRAPIFWDVPLDDALNGLQQGVVHGRESVLPGEIGRTFIIGHSAGYVWSNNPWSGVFALLDKVKSDDIVYLRRDDQTYAYKITQSIVVSPDQVDVIRDQSLGRNQLALMTCTPIGTTLNRLIVYAEPLRVE